MKKRDSSFKHLMYAMRQVWEADKLLLIFTLFKNSIEQVFYVFFFVYLTKYIFNCIERNIAYEKLFWFLVIACSLHVVVHFICGWYETYRKIKTPVVYKHIFYRVMDLSDSLELKDYESPDFYDKYARALDNCVDNAINITIRTGVFIGNVISTIMSLVIVVSVDPVLLVFLVIPIFVSFYFGKKNAKANYDRENSITRDKRTADYVKRVYYEKKYAAEVRLFDINNLMLDKQEKAVDAMEKTSLVYRMKSAFYSFLMKGSYSILAGIFAYFYVVFKVKYGNVADISSYVAMITAMAFSTDQLKAAVENRIYINNESKLFKNLEDFLEQDKEEKPNKTVIKDIETVELINISFTYPGAKKPTITDMSFKWKKGEKLAIVGYNGAGKTTLIKLIMGLYPVTSGKILINGIDINEIDLDEYRKRFGTVFQDLQVFAMTLSENVLMRRPENEADYEIVKKALKNAQFDITHRGLTKGLDTMISREFDEEGFVPSGGQAQKIAIARVFAHNPDMVILDEPSSALDPLAEYNMYNNMMKLSEGKGVIFISHRLSSARMADEIFLMKDGKIVEDGTHDELMARGGYYHEMFMLQAENYQDSIPEEMLKGAAAYYG
ncbi:ABC transporter ATP-binding protein [Butyrivibrio sp. CB08]|uniref:ABC transporter ATP-binding protein n=1 Tax=Butyrivibrio sp. CB08 TaxID=2364879 RepID=UPI000EA8419E|nr:ABC transporter ATP-binding protein [Butyrivibrio sp. CB08]RKM59448.1 ABC transporter ATP-binding protein [Butyrivibrio sp. CB08]